MAIGSFKQGNAMVKGSHFCSFPRLLSNIFPLTILEHKVGVHWWDLLVTHPPRRIWLSQRKDVGRLWKLKYSRIKLTSPECRMHLGTNGKYFYYKMRTQGFELRWGDLGILGDPSVTLSHQCNVAMRKANAIIGCIQLWISMNFDVSNYDRHYDFLEDIGNYKWYI